jgi:paired small multidrug resistance pump
MAYIGFTDIIGFIGVGIILIAYCLLQANRLSAKHLSYSLMNLIGASMILFSLFYTWNTPAVFIEIAWILISLYGVVKSLR